MKILHQIKLQRMHHFVARHLQVYTLLWQSLQHPETACPEGQTGASVRHKTHKTNSGADSTHCNAVFIPIGGITLQHSHFNSLAGSPGGCQLMPQEGDITLDAVEEGTVCRALGLQRREALRHCSLQRGWRPGLVSCLHWPVLLECTIFFF